MEHDFEILSQKTGITDRSKLNILLAYAELIYHENKKFNLTGHKTLFEIINNLIIGSLHPVIKMNVPRGTFFADLGTGAGVPGVPLAVKYPDISGILFDSTRKKTDFIGRATAMLKIENIKAVNTRIEDAGRSAEFREKFDLVVTRAMSDLYTITELGSPLLKTGGHLFVYTNIGKDEINEYVSAHICSLGLIIDNTDRELCFPASCLEGITLKKINNIDDLYPRRMAMIKRMAANK